MEMYTNNEKPDGIMIEHEDAEAPSTAELVQCNTCKRSFNPKVLVKHAVICQNLANKKRKVFDSSRQRAEGTDISILKPMKPKPESPKKQANWHKKHEDVVANSRGVRTVALAVKDGGPLPPPPPPTYDQDYVQCPYCQRTFNQHAGERHIKFCQEQAARMPRKGKLAEEKKPPARTQYKPPAPVKKATPTAAPSIPPALPPQRAGPGQPTGIPPNKMLSEVFTRTNSFGLTSPPPCIGNRSGAMSSGGRPVRNTRSGTGLDRKKTDPWESDAQNETSNGGTKSKFCHGCGSKYPVESAKFCCKCGIKRIII